MLRTTLASTALVAAFALAACERPNQNAKAPEDSSQLQSAPAGDTSQPTNSTMDDTGPMLTAGVPLIDVQNPQKTLTNAAVKDSKGDAIGEVKSVSLDDGGKIQAVNVGIGTRTVALKADGLKYMQAENTVVSPQTKDEIQKLK